MPEGRFHIRPLTLKSEKRIEKSILAAESFFYCNVENIPLRLKPVFSPSDETGSSSFYRGKEGRALKIDPDDL